MDTAGALPGVAAPADTAPGIKPHAPAHTAAEIKSLEEAVKADSSSAKKHFDLGNAYYDQGRLNEALSQFHRVLAIDSTFWKAWVNVGTVQDELSRLDAQLQTARSTMDVSNPQAVARFRELLERRDAVYKHSIGLVTGDIGAANQRYNTRVGEYNSRCANRPRDPGLVASIQATLSCPPGY